MTLRIFPANTERNFSEIRFLEPIDSEKKTKDDVEISKIEEYFSNSSGLAGLLPASISERYDFEIFSSFARSICFIS